MYIDPGFGSLMVQFGIAALAVLGASFAMFRARITAFFKKEKPDSSIDNEESDSKGSDSANE